MSECLTHHWSSIIKYNSWRNEEKKKKKKTKPNTFKQNLKKYYSQESHIFMKNFMNVFSIVNAINIIIVDITTIIIIIIILNTLPNLIWSFLERPQWK